MSILLFIFTCYVYTLSLHSFPTRRSSDLVWFFFSAPVAASVARKMGCYLITETMSRRHQLSMDSYDRDRKSTRLNSSHMSISYAVFCLKKKNKKITS